MDVHMKTESQIQFQTNDTSGHISVQEDDLTSLSQEEQDILHFFEQTIDSLEQSLEEDELRPQINSLNNSAHVVDGATYSSPHLQVSPKEQDIIDLVRQSKPDLVQTKDTSFTPTSPDFQSLIQHPDSHFEIKPRHEQADPLPDRIPTTTTTDSYPLYHPPGSIPTPVLIAQKIAENQAGGGSVLSASSLLRRRSSEFDKSTSSSKQGPPTSTKPARYPANINVILGNREQPSQSLASVKLEERRAQVLANLSGTAHPLVQEAILQDQKDRNTPTRSVSFRDPTPEKSRREALSKLGLTRNRALSVGVSHQSAQLELLASREAHTANLENSDLPDSSKAPDLTNASNVMPLSTPQEPSNPSIMKPRDQASSATVPTSSKVLETTPRSPVQSNKKAPPLDVQKSSYTPSYSPPPAFSEQDNFQFPSPPPPVETPPEFNSYGGKSVVVNPSASLKTDLPSPPLSPEAKTLSPILPTPTEFNSYGGKSKVVTPIPVPVVRKDLPDILSSHIDKSHTPYSPSGNDSKSYGGNTRTVNPSGSATHPSESGPRTSKPPAPLPAPRPPRHSYHGTTASAKSPQRALSPEHKRRTGSMFRPLGITVQFPGKGGSDDLRRDALRKLGLHKD